MAFSNFDQRGRKLAAAPMPAGPRVIRVGVDEQVIALEKERAPTVTRNAA